MKRANRLIEIIRDDVSKIVRVRLRNSHEFATLDASAFDDLVARGVSIDWLRNQHTHFKVSVRVKGQSAYTPVAISTITHIDGASATSFDGWC